MSNHLRRKRAYSVTPVVVDTIVGGTALAIACYFAEIPLGGSFLSLVSSASIAMSIVLLCNMAVGLYSGGSRLEKTFLRRGVVGGFTAIMVLQLLNILLEHTLAVEALSLSIVAIVAINATWRYAHGAIRDHIPHSPLKIVIIGAGQRAAFLSRRMRRLRDRRHFKGWQFYQLQSLCSDIENNGDQVEYGQNFSDWLDQENPDLIVLANEVDEPIDPQASHTLMQWKLSGTEVLDLEEFVERELGQLAVEKMTPEWILLSQGFKPRSTFFDGVNYLLNATLAIIVFTLTLPIILATMLAIYLEDGRRDNAGIIYKQCRVGVDGRLFDVFKFRSMGINAESNGAQWAQENDPRVTRVGAFIRKYRIDELPQLFNVLRGDMCFVGPRPERPEFVNQLNQKIPYFDFRHTVKPGLTGWAQINYPYGASDDASQEKLKYDLYYIKNRSFILDFFVLVRTVEVVLFGKGR